LGPESAHSPNADDLNALYWVMVIVAVALVVAINAALVAFALRFRARRGSEPRRLRSRGPTQALIAGAFALLAALLFVAGVIVTENASEVEASGDEGLQASNRVTAQRGLGLPSGDDATEPLEVEASGQQWIWRYEYPDGTFSYYELVVPVDTAVVVKLASTDVVHRWWVPGLGGKFDATPGESNQTWFKADEEGTFDGASYQFSGAAYAAMRTAVRVVTVEEYEAWLEQQASDIEAAQALVQEQVASDTQLADPTTEGGGGATEGSTDSGATPSGGSGSAEGSQ
jgi:heme/copper-type cytochrome/quinol oxidase subunit 2